MTGLLLFMLVATNKNTSDIVTQFKNLLTSVNLEIEAVGKSWAFWILIAIIILFSIYSYSNKRYVSLFDSITLTLHELTKLFTTLITDILKGVGVLFNFIKLLKELFFGNLNARVVRKLCTYGIIFLSIVSFITTYSGMRGIFAFYNAALVAFGVQALLLVIASRIVMIINQDQGDKVLFTNRVIIKILVFCIGIPISLVLVFLLIDMSLTRTQLGIEGIKQAFSLPVLIACFAFAFFIFLYTKYKATIKNGGGISEIEKSDFTKQNVRNIDRLIILVALAISLSSMFSYMYIYDGLFRNVEDLDDTFVATKTAGLYLAEINEITNTAENEIFGELGYLKKQILDIEISYLKDTIEEEEKLEGKAGYDNNSTQTMNIENAYIEFINRMAEAEKDRKIYNEIEEKIKRTNQYIADTGEEWTDKGFEISEDDINSLFALGNIINESEQKEINKLIDDLEKVNKENDKSKIKNSLSAKINGLSRNMKYHSSIKEDNIPVFEEELKDILGINTKGEEVLLEIKNKIERLNAVNKFIETKSIPTEHRESFEDSYIVEYMNVLGNILSKEKITEDLNYQKPLLLTAYNIYIFKTKFPKGFSTDYIDELTLKISNQDIAKLRDRGEDSTDINIQNKSRTSTEIVDKALDIISAYPDISGLSTPEGNVFAKDCGIEIIRKKNQLLDLSRSVSGKTHLFERAFRKLIDSKSYPLMAVWAMFIALTMDVSIVILYLLRGKKGFRDASLTCIRIIYKYAKSKTDSKVRDENISNIQIANMIAIIITALLSINFILGNIHSDFMGTILIFFALSLFLNGIRIITFGIKKNREQKIAKYTKYNSVENQDFDKFYDKNFYESMGLDNYNYVNIAQDKFDNYSIMFMINYEDLRDKFCDSFVFLLMNIIPEKTKDSNKIYTKGNKNADESKDENIKGNENDNSGGRTFFEENFSVEVNQLLNLGNNDLNKASLLVNEQERSIKAKIKSVKDEISVCTRNLKGTSFLEILKLFPLFKGLDNKRNNHKTKEETMFEKFFWSEEDIKAEAEYYDVDIDDEIINTFNKLNSSSGFTDIISLEYKLEFYKYILTQLEIRKEKYTGIINVNSKLSGKNQTPKNIQNSIVQGKKEPYKKIGYIEQDIIEKTGYMAMMLSLQQYEVVIFESKDGNSRFYVTNEFIRLINEILITADIDIDDTYEEEFEEFDEDIY